MTTTAFIPIADDMAAAFSLSVELKNFARKKGFCVDSIVFSDKIDSNALIERLKPGDRLFIPEMISLGNSILEIVRNLKAILDRGAYLYAVEGEYCFDESMDIPATLKMMELAAEIDSKVISIRTKKAIRRKKSSGLKVGRPTGTKVKFSRIEENMEYINRASGEGVAIIDICRHIGVSYSTYQRYFAQRRAG